MKFLFVYSFDKSVVVDFELVLNYSLEYPGEELKDHSRVMSKLLKQFQDSEWFFDNLPSDLCDLDEHNLDFYFQKSELHVLALCVDHYVSLDDTFSLRLKNRLLMVLLFTFFH